jgi:two-component system KDP operon response regulator KdpE
MPRVLLIDSDPRIRRTLRTSLVLDGFTVDWFERGSAALRALKSKEAAPPDAVIIDPAAQGIGGMAACHKLRDYTAAPIIILSSSYSEANVVAALQNGADEYLAKPVSNDELTARLRAILRRSNQNGPQQAVDPLRFGSLEISLDHYSVRKKGRKVDLSPTEFRLLACLVREPGRVVSHRKLMARVWGAEYVESRHYLRLYVRYLREKLEDDPSSPRLILSEWGLGYRFQPPER